MHREQFYQPWGGEVMAAPGRAVEYKTGIKIPTREPKHTWGVSHCVSPDCWVPPTQNPCVPLTWEVQTSRNTLSMCWKHREPSSPAGDDRVTPKFPVLQRRGEQGEAHTVKPLCQQQ